MLGGWPYRRAAALVPLALSGCDCRGGEAEPGAEPEPSIEAAEVPVGGWYRAELRSDSGEVIPFYLSLPADYDSAGARVRNGEQQLVADHAWRATRVTVEFPIFGTRIEADAGRGGELTGSFRHESLAFGDSELAFAAAPVSEPDPESRFVPAEDLAQVEEIAEDWRLRFEDTGDAQLTLTRRGETAVEGALKLENGNVVYLAGNARGDALMLSGFDGSSPYLLEADLAGQSLEGAWLAGPGLDWRERVTGTADADFAVEGDVSLTPGVYRLPVPELSQAPFDDSPVILALTGSWSPASMRALPFLNELYVEHRDAGLEILALNYELTENEAHNDEAAVRIATLHDVPWEVVPVDGLASDFAAAVPAGLDNIDAQGFPVLVFIDRNGGVRDVRAGFPPEAAAELYERTLSDYRALAAEIAADEH